MNKETILEMLKKIRNILDKDFTDEQLASFIGGEFIEIASNSPLHQVIINVISIIIDSMRPYLRTMCIDHLEEAICADDQLKKRYEHLKYDILLAMICSTGVQNDPKTTSKNENLQSSISA